MQAAIDDDAATDEEADVEIGIVAPGAAIAEEEFRSTCGGGVVAVMNGPLHARRDRRTEVEASPDVESAGRCADSFGPVPQFEGCGDAEPRDACDLAAGHALCQQFHAAFSEGYDLGRNRIAIGLAESGTDPAGEIEQHEIGRPAPKLQSDGIGAFGIERERDQGLAHLAALRSLALEEIVRFELADDDRNGLG